MTLRNTFPAWTLGCPSSNEGKELKNLFIPPSFQGSSQGVDKTMETYFRARWKGNKQTLIMLRLDKDMEEQGF